MQPEGLQVDVKMSQAKQIQTALSGGKTKK